MTIPGTHSPVRQLRVVLSSTALLSFMSVWKAAALGIAELGAGAWFVPGIAGSALGGAMPWFVLAAALLGVFIRAVDVESWSMFLPAGCGWTHRSGVRPRGRPAGGGDGCCRASPARGAGLHDRGALRRRHRLP